MEQNTQEWLDIRRSKIGSSDAPIIMEESPYGTPYQLWEEKRGLFVRETHAGMRYGHDMEPIARRLLEDELMCTLEPRVVFHPEKTWMMASLDGINIDAGIAAEIKNPSEEVHEEARSGNIPLKYKAQIQHQLAILFPMYGINQMYYFSHRRGDTVLLTVAMDPEYIHKMVEKEYQFWVKVRDGICPEKSAKDYVDISDEYTVGVANELIEINNKIRELKDKEKSLKKILIDSSDGKNSVCGSVKISKVITKGTIDYESIPELMDVDLEQYRKESNETWRVSVG